MNLRSRPYRVLVGRLFHESHTFLAERTGAGGFEIRLGADALLAEGDQSPPDAILTTGLHKALIIGLLIMVFSQINGVNMMLLYGPSILLGAAICGACVLFCWKALPETKGLTLEEIGAFWLRLGKNPDPESRP